MNYLFKMWRHDVSITVLVAGGGTSIPFRVIELAVNAIAKGLAENMREMFLTRQFSPRLFLKYSIAALF